MSIFHQITRDIPVGRNQHKDDRALVDAAKPRNTSMIMSRPFIGRRNKFSV